MMPASPDPESPCGRSPRAVGSASAAHFSGSAVQPLENPHNLAGDVAPWMSATSYPAGNLPRIRRMLSGLMCTGWFVDGRAAVDDGVGPGGAGEPHAPASRTANRMNLRSGTSV